MTCGLNKNGLDEAHIFAHLCTAGGADLGSCGTFKI